MALLLLASSQEFGIPKPNSNTCHYQLRFLRTLSLEHSNQSYSTPRSRVGGLVGLLKSPLRLKPGALVELKTTSCMSFAIRSLINARSFLISPTNALTFRCISSGVNPNCPTAHLMTPNFSLYSLPPTSPFTVPAMSFVIVPVFELGIRPFGPSILPKAALLSF